MTSTVFSLLLACPTTLALCFLHVQQPHRDYDCAISLTTVNAKSSWAVLNKDDFVTCGKAQHYKNISL